MKTTKMLKKYNIYNVLKKEFVKSTNSFRLAKEYYIDSSNVFGVYDKDGDKLVLHDGKFLVV